MAGCTPQTQRVDIMADDEQAAAPAPTPEPTPAPYVTEDIFVVEAEEAINLRAKSSSSSELLDTLKPGDRVRVLGYQSQRFAKVRRLSDNLEGYAIAGYLKAEDYGAFGLTVVQPVALYSYEQMMADLAALAGAYPGLCTLESAGTSAEGRELQVLLVGDAASRHHVFVQAAIHAREHMTALLTTAMAERLLQQGGAADVCFHILPMANPDGVTIQQNETIPAGIAGIYTNDGVKGLSVETGALYLEQWQANANGVDLNRNFDAMWDKINTTADASFMNYRGAAPGSEPETKAMVAYTERYAFDATLSYHATGSAIYWEFGQDTAVNAASLSMAEAIKGVSAYELIGDKGGSYGGYKDWAMLQKKIPSVTIEVGTRPAPLMEAEFSNLWFRNRDVLQAVAAWVQGR
jgi:g-D-glutamyl-meso-diaminopimelate peptidase